MKIVTKRARQRTIGRATKRIRDRHSGCGSPIRTSISGNATSTPSVSPTHHVTQFPVRSAAGTMPCALRPLRDSVALIKQITGASRRKSKRRSEERRVGKECRCREGGYQAKEEE